MLSFVAAFSIVDTLDTTGRVLNGAANDCVLSEAFLPVSELHRALRGRHHQHHLRLLKLRDPLIQDQRQSELLNRGLNYLSALQINLALHYLLLLRQFMKLNLRGIRLIVSKKAHMLDFEVLKI